MNPEPNAEQPRDGDPVAANTAQHSDTSSKRIIKEQQQRNWEYEQQFPLLRGFSLGDIVVVPCPLCDSWHIHGWEREDGPEIETLRCAHCKKRDPMSYRVSVFRQADLYNLDRRANFYGFDLRLFDLTKASEKCAVRGKVDPVGERRRLIQAVWDEPGEQILREITAEKKKLRAKNRANEKADFEAKCRAERAQMRKLEGELCSQEKQARVFRKGGRNRE